jgi:WD40 repeat protein
VTVTSPYRGLAPFEDSELDALYFFGRERDSEIVVANLIASRLTVLYGPSGVGKSSLLRASVARTLRALPEEPIVVVFDRWGEDPAAALAAAVAAAAGLEDGPLRDVLERAQLSRDVYLILDQTEEYFLYHQLPTDVERDLADVIGSPLRVNAILAVREDALATLDRFLGRIPALYGNILRLERLDAGSARSAIVGPVERFSELTGEHVGIEDPLVDAVTGEVGSGRIRQGLGGDGVANGNGAAAGVEAPYLQVVMQRLWDVEREAGSDVLRLATLERLGGARRVVADHLQRALGGLSPVQQDLAASVFGLLVTPSGAKIAHAPEDLAEYAAVPVASLSPVLDVLAERRILRRDEFGRYEIFHDVLAAEVLAWRRRHETTRAVERERAAARRRQRRLGLIAALALVGLAVAGGLAVWALAERRNAQEQTAAAQAAEQTASEQAVIAREAQKEAQNQAAAASQAKKDALAQAAEAQKSEQNAQSAQAEAERNAQAAQAAERRALDQAEVAQTERARADTQASAARAARARAQQQAVAATRARHSAEQATAVAKDERAKAERATVSTRARERLAQARALLASDPEGGLQAALESLALDPSSPVEPVLREGLLRSRALDILPAGGGAVVSAIPGADTSGTQSLRTSGSEGGGDAIVTTTRTGIVRVFDARLGQLRRTIGTGRPANSAALASDHRTLAVGGPDGTVRLYSIVSGRLLRSLLHVGPVSSVSFSPDGRFVASGGTNETAKVWDVGTGALVLRLAHPRAVRSVSFSPDGTRLLTLSGDRFVRVFDLATGKLAARLDQGDMPTSAVVSPDGRRILTTGENDTPRVWDADTGKLIMPLVGHTGDVLAAAYSAAGDRIATAATDGTARVWDAESGRLLLELVGHTSFVTAVAFSPDGRQIVTASRDGTARVWNAGSGGDQAQLLGHRGRVTAVAFGPDGRWVVTASDDGTARTWSLGSDPQLRPIAEGASPVRDIAASVDGSLVAEARADGTVTVRSPEGRPVIGVRLDAPATSVALSDDGRRLLATAEDGSVAVWALPGGAQVARFDYGGPVAAGAFLPRAAGVVAAGQSGIVRLWDLRTRVARVVASEGEPVADVAVTADGTYVATAVGDVAHVRALAPGSRAGVFTGHRDDVTSVSFSPDRKHLLTASFDHDVAMWNVATGALEKTLVGHVAVVRGAAFSPDGRWIVTAGPTRAGLWEAGMSTLVDSRLFYLAGHRGALSAVAFTGPKWRVYTGGVDGTVRRYDCRLCAGASVLARIAASKLARLESDAKR